MKNTFTAKAQRRKGVQWCMITMRIEAAFAIVRDNPTYTGIKPMFGEWCVH